MDYAKHLYLILYPNPSLVASQCAPAEFTRHYQVGSTRYYAGKLIFAEVDIAYRHPYFDLDNLLAQVVPHEDGTPKATKFVKSYRALEHVDLDAIQQLYLATASGDVLGLAPGSDDALAPNERMRLIAEICPLSMLVLTRLGYKSFGKYLTDPTNPKGAPTMFYTSLDLDLDEFLREFEANPFMPSPLSSVHPSKLRDAVHELKSKSAKTTKGLALSAPLEAISYKMIRHGFWFANTQKHRFFPMPPARQIESNHYKFWRSM